MISAQRHGGRREVAAGTGGGTPNKPELIHAEARRRGAGQRPRQPSSSLRASAPPRAPNVIETDDRAATSAKPNDPLRVLRASARTHPCSNVHAKPRSREDVSRGLAPALLLRAFASSRESLFIGTDDRATTLAKPHAPLRVLRASARIHLFCTPAKAGAQLGDAEDKAYHVITTTTPTGPRPSPEYQGAMR
jgi:hypothetical protein